MPVTSRLYTKDEELGKRDDDFRPKPKDNMSERLNPLRWRKRRLFTILSICVLLYFFVKNIPTDLGTAESRLNPVYRQRQTQPISETTKPSEPIPPATIRTDGEPSDAPPRLDNVESQELERRYFNGQIKYYRLAATLNRVNALSHDAELNRNILFAASSMKSLANLLPLACEMADNQLNWVNFVIMSRVELSIDEIKIINGISEACPSLAFHDARSDYCEFSSDLRHEAAVAGGLSHIKSHMNPRAVIVDDELAEDITFSRAIRRRSKEAFIPLIEIPSGAYDNFKFITKLDHASLGHWHAPTIEIVIQAQKESVGSFIRLLRTLAAAEYGGLRMPKLTLNLATSIQPGLKTFLSNFKWPPRYEPATRTVDPVTIRHQVPSQQLSSEQAAARFVESFYPADRDHHVLLLSPQVEVSPQYMLYLQYMILRYKYSYNGTHGHGDLLGISLDVPTSRLNGETFQVEGDDHFLYALPSSSSLLVFGDKWFTFHSYLTHRISATHLGVAAKREKLIPETTPAWAEYLLELVRARGWITLYPGKGFATVHNELAQIPEEYTKDEEPLSTETSNLEEPFLTATIMPKHQQHKEELLPNAQTPLHHLVPSVAKLEQFTMLSYTGDHIQWNDLQHSTADYAQEFRREIGGCADTEARRPRIIYDDNADDLFCLPAVDMVFDTRAEEAAA